VNAFPIVARSSHFLHSPRRITELLQNENPPRSGFFYELRLHLPFFSIFEGTEGKSLKDIPDQKKRRHTPMRDSGFVTFILILALLYIISPIDLVPDVIPIAGWADDVAVGIGAGAAALAAGRR
jgi:hypothetical protein